MTKWKSYCVTHFVFEKVGLYVFYAKLRVKYVNKDDRIEEYHGDSIETKLSMFFGDMSVFFFYFRSSVK